MKGRAVLELRGGGCAAAVPGADRSPTLESFGFTAEPPLARWCDLPATGLGCMRSGG